VNTLVATFLTIVAIGENAGISPITAAVVESCQGSMLSKVYPAKVSMWDRGWLAMSGFVSATMSMMFMPMSVPIIGLIYFAEMLSVIIQVHYFK